MKSQKVKSIMNEVSEDIKKFSSGMTIETLQNLRESEDRVEFKEAKRNFPFNGGAHREQSERRKCVLGYLTALSNEGGGMLILGMDNQYPHRVVGTNFAVGKVGEIEDSIYTHLQMRVKVEELSSEDGKRVIVFHAPSRPVGKLMKFEGVALMRTGDSLRNMSDDEVYRILSESEPDFSAKHCVGLKLTDLDRVAIETLKTKYAQKQRNPSFQSLSDKQVLSDLGLMIDGKLTYAALILVGKREAIQRHLPQAKIMLEYRHHESQIPFDWREEVCDPLFVGIDRAWQLVHSRNALDHYRFGPYIFDIQVFDETVVREALLNAITHRDYRLTSEVVVKQYPRKLLINNPGGFPKGVSVENLISVSSTPRSRLIADVLLKTGLVERSGQGIDKIFAITLGQGKPMPDYNRSDPFQVSLSLDATTSNGKFYQFCQLVAEQMEEKEEHLGVHDIMTLMAVRDGRPIHPDLEGHLERLLDLGFVQRVGSGYSRRFILGKIYEDLSNEIIHIGKYTSIEIGIIVSLFEDKEKGLQIGDILNAFHPLYTRDQVRYIVGKLVDDGVMIKEGAGNKTTYRISTKIIKSGSLETNIYNHLSGIYE